MPYEATATEVCRFFKDCDIAGGPDGILLHPETNSLSWTFFQSWSKMNYHFFDAGIYFCLNDRGLPTGEAFIEMETPQVDKVYPPGCVILRLAGCGQGHGPPQGDDGPQVDLAKCTMYTVQL